MPTHYHGTARERRAINAYICLLRAAESVAARTFERLHGYGLSESQFAVLEALLHLGPLCQKELGQKLLKSGGNLTLVINNLEKQQLVTRVRSETDRRYITVHLTDKGQRLIQEVFPLHAQGIQDEMRILSAEEQDTLRHLCRSLGKQERLTKPKKTRGTQSGGPT